MAKGIDRADSFNTQDELNFLSCIKNSYGIEFVGRYYKPSSSSSYLLTRTEAQNISRLGLYIAAVYQNRGRYPSDFSYNIGKDDCNYAIGCAENVGQPKNTTIYFAVDFDAYNTPGAMENIRDYFRGVNDAMNYFYKTNSYKWYIGIYAGRQVCEDIKSLGLAYHIWQAAAWRYGKDCSYNIKQTAIDQSVTCNGFATSIDWDESSGSYGGFKIS